MSATEVAHTDAVKIYPKDPDADVHPRWSHPMCGATYVRTKIHKLQSQSFSPTLVARDGHARVKHIQAAFPVVWPLCPQVVLYPPFQGVAAGGHDGGRRVHSRQYQQQATESDARVSAQGITQGSQFLVRHRRQKRWSDCGKKRQGRKKQSMTETETGNRTEDARLRNAAERNSTRGPTQ